MARSEEARGVLSSDTSLDVERLQVLRWRSLSSVEVAALVAGASRAVRALALERLRGRHPQATDAELVARLVGLTAGAELARRAYPEFAHLPELAE